MVFQYIKYKHHLKNNSYICKMKWKHKNRIAYELSKEFWNNSDESLRYKMLFNYMGYLNSVIHISLDNHDLIELSKCDWKEIPLYKCRIPASDLRTSVSYHLGIGSYEGYKSGDIQYQREYKLRLLRKNGNRKETN